MTQPTSVPKVCGADIELGNTLRGVPPGPMSGAIASRALLREIEGYSSPLEYTAPTTYVVAAPDGWSDSRYAPNPQDWGRRYLGNGGCAYIDLNHLELCIPEVTSAYDHVAAWHAMLRIGQRALAAANARLPEHVRVQVLCNNSDGFSHAWGAHVSFLLTRTAFDDLMHRRLQHMLWLASYQCSSIVFTGQGKVGAENGRPAVDFQIAQRADFFETLFGEQTTYHRPIINSRDEALCGRSESGLARLHCIFYDNTLCHGSTLLKVGVMQCILAMIEAGQIDQAHMLDAPLDALQRWSHDPTLTARAATVAGRDVTAVEHQLLFLADAHRFAAAGGFTGIVPRADEILALWGDTIEHLHAGRLAAVAPRLDWVLKLGALRRTLNRHPDLTWRSPGLKHLDHLYSSLDPGDGLYWKLAHAGATEQLVSDEAVALRVHEPPEDTRAWTRAMLLRRAGAERIDQIDWDTIRFRTTPAWSTTGTRTFTLSDPLGLTRADAAAAFAGDADLDDILNALETPRWQH